MHARVHSAAGDLVEYPGNLLNGWHNSHNTRSSCLCVQPCIPFLPVAVPLVPTYAAFTLATSKGRDAGPGVLDGGGAMEEAVGVQQDAEAG